MSRIEIGDEEGERLTLELADRAYPNATDYWDGNWIRCTVDVTAGAFHGHLDGLIRTDELATFHRQVEALYERLSGEAVFETMESWLSIRLVGDGRGHIDAVCRLRDDPVFGNTLDCRIEFDQTSLRLIARDLAAAAHAYPIIGR